MDKCTVKLLVIQSLLVSNVLAQVCRSSGQSCSDSSNCCGGCCIGDVCIDTVKLDCRRILNPCSAELGYCPPNSMCTVFQPDCMGCEAQKLCKPSPKPPEVSTFPGDEILDNFARNNTFSWALSAFCLVVCLMLL